jgi:proteasome accessory factor C
MAEGGAAAQLSRILEILPHAAREDGVALDELARALETEPRSIVRDLQEVYTRSFYQPPGSGEGIQVAIEPERVQVWTTGDFRRPVRLSMGETLALDLGLRMLAAESPEPARAAMLELAARLESRLSAAGSDVLNDLVGADPPVGDAGARAVVGEAARRRRRCAIRYLKRGAPEPELREIDPYALVIAGGRTYVIGHCHTAGGIRVFRHDRIVEARLTDRAFQPPDDFDAEAYLSDGRVFRAEDAPEVAVRYAPRIARWLREQGPVEELEDGSVVVRYPLADPAWAVAHVLRHGADAEILEPREVREMVIAAAEHAGRGG